MGGFKPLLDIGGKPALLRLLDTIRAAGIEDLVVVTGHERDAVESALAAYGDATQKNGSFEHNGDGSFYVSLRTQQEPSPCVSLCVSCVFNETYESGMFSSVQTGVRRAATMGEAGAALLFPADVPLVSVGTILGLLDVCEKDGPPRFAVPVFNGRNGHPLLIPSAFYKEILAYKGEGGLKEIRNRHSAEMLRYEVDDEGCVLDMDTPEDYEYLLDYAEKAAGKMRDE